MRSFALRPLLPSRTHPIDARRRRDIIRHDGEAGRNQFMTARHIGRSVSAAATFRAAAFVHLASALRKSVCVFGLVGMYTKVALICTVAHGAFPTDPATPASEFEAAETSTHVEQPVTFERDVMSVLSKAGCNAGTCHGNINGKGGFFLSLRGVYADYDHSQVVHASHGRRVNLLEPEQSLLLLKATNQIPHEGGKRFSADSPEYGILQRWLADGATPPAEQAPRVIRLEVTPTDSVLWYPQNEQALQVTAHFSDGASRDVTRLSVYEPSDPLVKVDVHGRVRFNAPGVVTVLVRYLDGQQPVRVACRTEVQQYAWDHGVPNNFIDDAIFARLKQLKLRPAERASDSVFVRRVYLDVLGILPTEDEARAFVADSHSDKRERLVEHLLTRPEFAQLWALKWSDLVRNEEKTLDAKGVQLLHQWMREQFAQDRPLNEFAHELIVARGSTYENPPANYWRAHREPFIRAETTAQVFLGVRLQCAKCHNHPFDRWSQDEYYQWSSLFGGIDYEIVSNERKDRLDQHEFVGDQIVQIKGEVNVDNARTGQPALPKLLGSDRAVEGDRLTALADWMTAAENELFAQAQVNRIWFHLMGRGLVEPIDDLRLTNPASHPELLVRLAEDFVAHNYSLKHLVRKILLSSSYQLDSRMDESQFGEEEQYDERLFAQAVVRRLSAEQLLDCQSQVLGLPADFEGYEAGTRAGELAGVERVRRKLSDDDQFLRRFGKPERLLACECERSDQPTLGQALTLVGSQSLHRRLKSSKNRIGHCIEQGMEPAAIVESLYWTALSRPPTATELDGVMQLVTETGDLRLVLEDLTWALLNAKELVFRN
jgi:hypothetical protein